jgi:hypothetical protein
MDSEVRSHLSERILAPDDFGLSGHHIAPPLLALVAVPGDAVMVAPDVGAPIAAAVCEAVKPSR